MAVAFNKRTFIIHILASPQPPSTSRALARLNLHPTSNNRLGGSLWDAPDGHDELLDEAAGLPRPDGQRDEDQSSLGEEALRCHPISPDVVFV